ncbi:hypothetical protein BJX76DRAFT_341915 [Aspergillus varians]
MPPRRAVSPLALETCSPRDSDFDGYELAISDDELDKGQRSARRRRVEKLGETYLQGIPLFILSASLRGPLDKGWVNPWKKNRKKVTGDERENGPVEQPVIPETNSRKRRCHTTPSVVSHSKSSATPRASSRSDRPREDALGIKSTDRVLGLEPTAVGSQSPRFTRYNPRDARWLKKDKVSTRFQNIDPPTSPTTSISSRVLRKGGTITSQQTGRLGAAGYGSATSSKDHQAKQSKEREPRPGLEQETNNLPFDGRRDTSGSNLLKDCSQSVNAGESVHVVSSSSQLPKFEYRLMHHGKYIAKIDDRPSPKPTRHTCSEPVIVGTSGIPMDGHEHPDQKPPTKRSGESGQAEANVWQDTENSSTNATHTIENPQSPNLDKGLVSNPTNGTASENKIPSAQHAPGNPAPSDNLTSLYSIAVSKATSNPTEDHNTDQPFSTQAALIMAQKTFQNDLRSPECSPVASAKKRRASQEPNHHSPSAVNITPFHKMNTPDRETVHRHGAPGTARVQMMSTQYMIDTATPFTFSTEKKAEFRALSSAKDKSKGKKRKTTSFALSSPSEIPLEHWTPDEDRIGSIMQQQPVEPRNSPSGSQQSALPMTLTGTTPPTAQEGQDAESFNLSQAIAEAGSWLQQSFEINQDITPWKSAQQLHQPYSANPAH